MWTVEFLLMLMALLHVSDEKKYLAKIRWKPTLNLRKYVTAKCLSNIVILIIKSMWSLPKDISSAVQYKIIKISGTSDNESTAATSRKSYNNRQMGEDYFFGTLDYNQEMCIVGMFFLIQFAIVKFSPSPNPNWGYCWF